MKINALTINEQNVQVEIDPNGNRHIMVAGEEISNIDRTDLQLSRQIDNALDDLYDLPIYEDGMIHTGKTKSVWAWHEATLVTKTYRIKPEYIDLWGSDANEDTLLTEDLLERIAEVWEVPMEKLLEQLYPNTPEEVQWYKWMAEKETARK